jgi:hypothetical protein
MKVRIPTQLFSCKSILNWSLAWTITTTDETSHTKRAQGTGIADVLAKCQRPTYTSLHRDQWTHLMWYLRKTYHETGDVVRIPACSGRPCILDSLGANVSYLFKSYLCLYISYISVSRRLHRVTTWHFTYRTARPPAGSLWGRGFNHNNYKDIA